VPHTREVKYAGRERIIKYGLVTQAHGKRWKVQKFSLADAEVYGEAVLTRLNQTRFCITRRLRNDHRLKISQDAAFAQFTTDKELTINWVICVGGVMQTKPALCQEPMDDTVSEDET